MTVYAPPLADIRFVLDGPAGLDDILSLPAFAHLDRDQVGDVLDHAARFAVDELAPLYRTGDLEGCRLENGSVKTPTGYAEAWQRFRDAGWCAATADASDGGLGLPRLVGGALAEIWNAANMPFALCAALTESAATLLARRGDERLRDLYLPKLVSGEWTGAMAMTEPQAGSDVGALACRAVPDGDSYRLSGQKIFISWGEHDMTPNIVHMVLARLPGAEDGHRGISLFLVPKFLPGEDGRPGARNDMRCIALERKMGLHASPTCVMEYGGAGGATGWLIGEPGRGLAAMFTMMNAARIAIGHEGLGLAERAYQHARLYARERRQGRNAHKPDDGPVPIVRHGDVRRTLLLMKARIEAMRALSADAGRAVDLARHHPAENARKDAASRLGVLTPLVKAWCTDSAVDIASDAIQVHGGAGYIEDTGVAQILRDARIAPIYEGTNGIQALDLLRRKLAGDGGRTIEAMLKDVARQADALRAAEDPATLAEIGKSLSAACEAATRTTRFLLSIMADGPSAADAAATPYLDQLAAVLAGRCLAAGALAAARDAAYSDRDANFRGAKISLARLYAAAILPRAIAREHEIRESAELFRTLPEEHL